MTHIPALRAFIRPRLLLALGLCSSGMLFAVFAVTGLPQRKAAQPDKRLRYTATPGGKASDLSRMEEEWHHRLTYPTGVFNPEWVRAALRQDSGKIGRASCRERV